MGVGWRSGSKKTPVPKVSRGLMAAAWAICVMGSRKGMAKATWSPHQNESKPSRSTSLTTPTSSSSVGIQGPVAGSVRRSMVLTPILSVASRARGIGYLLPVVGREGRVECHLIEDEAAVHVQGLPCDVARAG